MDSLAWPHVKTKIFKERLEQVGWTGRTLFISGKEEFPAELARSARNLVGIETKQAKDVTIHDALRWSRIVMDVEAVDFYEKTLAKCPLLPEPDSRTDKDRTKNKALAVRKAEELTSQIVKMQYIKRYGRWPLGEEQGQVVRGSGKKLPAIPRRLGEELESRT